LEPDQKLALSRFRFGIANGGLIFGVDHQSDADHQSFYATSVIMEDDPPYPIHRKPRRLTGREILFAQCVARGDSNADAYRKSFLPKTEVVESIARMAHVVSVRARVIREIARLRRRSEAKTILSMNDRLAILATDAQRKGASPAHINARARVIEVYSKISGDQAPERHEITGAAGGPVETVSTVVRRLSAGDRIEEMRLARLRRQAPATEPVAG
jgi:hypothetical protein